MLEIAPKKSHSKLPAFEVDIALSSQSFSAAAREARTWQNGEVILGMPWYLFRPGFVFVHQFFQFFFENPVLGKLDPFLKSSLQPFEGLGHPWEAHGFGVDPVLDLLVPVPCLGFHPVCFRDDSWFFSCLFCNSVGFVNSSVVFFFR